MVVKSRHQKQVIGGGLSDRERRFYDFLQHNPIGVLSTVTPTCEPHGVVVYYAVDTHFVTTFLTRIRTRKHDNLQHNNRVMLTVYEPHTQTTVQVLGEAQAVTDSVEISRIAGAIVGASTKAGHAGLPPVAKLDAGAYVGYRIAPRQLRMVVYAQPEAEEIEDIFESIESFDLEKL